MMSSIEVAIIGGGPAGIACAIMLAKANVRVCVIERQHGIPWKPGEIFDSRICIPLQHLGIWENFLQTQPIRASGTISSWGGEFIEKTAMIDPFGGALFADRHSFEGLLRDVARKAGILLMEGTDLVRCTRSVNRWQLDLSKGKQIFHLYTDYIIEANGRGKSYCERGDRQDYDALVALMGYADLPQNFRDLRFYLEAFDVGWAYAAPLPNQKIVIALLTDAYCLPKGKNNHQQFYFDQVMHLALMRKLRLGSISSVQVVSAKSSIRKAISGDGWLAIGEAAATYDPITGWGVVSALEKGIMAAELLIKKGISQAGKYYDEYEKARFEKYLHTRKTIYAQEQRWLGAPFWANRHTKS